MGPGIDAGRGFFTHGDIKTNTNEKTTIYAELDDGESSDAIEGYFDERDQRAPTGGRCRGLG